MKISHGLVFTFVSFLAYSYSLFGTPTVTGVNPVSGSISGNQQVTITGSGFTEPGPITVNFGSLPASSVNVQSDTQLTAITPTSLPLVVDVIVTSAHGSSAINQDDRYAFTMGNWTAFIPDFNSSNVYTSDVSTQQVNPHPIVVGSNPNDVSITPDGSTAYVVNSGSNNITPINVLNRTPGFPIPTNSNFPIFIALDTTMGHYVGFTADYLSNSVHKIDLSTGQIITSYIVGQKPTGIILTSSTNPIAAYTTNAGGESISHIDLSTNLVSTIATGAGSSPSNMVLAPNGTTAYFTDDNPHAFSLRQLLNVNTANPILGFTLKDPSFNFSGANLFPQVAISPDGTTLYATNTGSTTITVVDITNPSVPTVLYALDLNETGPNGAAITPDGKTLYVSNAMSNFISIVSGLPRSPTILNLPVGTTPTDPVITPDQAPLAHFTLSPLPPGFVGQPLMFDASSSVSPVGTIKNYHWNFGDGTITDISSSSIQHTYTQTGFYTVTLTVTNSAGTSIASSSVYNGEAMIRNGGPSAVYTLSFFINTSTGDVTSTTLASSNNPSNINDSVTFTATVTDTTNPHETPTGSVQFTINGSSYGSPVLLNGSGQAQIANTFTSGGTYRIDALYQPNNPNFNASAATILNQVVNPDPTATTLSITPPSPSTPGTTLNFSGNVTDTTIPGLTPNGGTLQILYTTATNPNPAILNAQTLGANGHFTFSYSALPSNTYHFYAQYLPGNADPNHSGSTSPIINYTINLHGTTTTVSSNHNPSTFGQPVTFTATVTPGTGTSGNPTGTVTFFDGTTSLGTGTLSTTSGVTTATLTTSTLSVGSHSITASYGGDTDHQGSTSSPLTQGVSQNTTTTTITTSGSPSVFGQPVTFTATVTPGTGTSGNPTGTVTFFDGTTSLGAGTLSTTAGVTTATLTTSILSVGSHSITASYEGDTDHQGSTSSPLTQGVSQDTTTTTITTSGSPSVFGQPVTFTATVTPVTGTSGNPTGTVTFFDGTTSLGTGTLSTTGGVTTATFTTSTLSVGSHSITASYEGDTDHQGSTSSPLTQGVSQNTTTTTITTSGSPSVFGQPVTFTATVAPGTGTSGNPTGTVTFFDGTTSLGTGTLSTTAGVTTATLTTSTLSVGSHSITASYEGDTDHQGSTSSPLTQGVSQDTTTTTITTSGSSSVFGQPVTFTATVTPGTGTSGNPTGTVTFFDGTTSLGIGTLSTTGGVTTATFTTSTLSVGFHFITASYVGDTDHQGSTSSPMTQFASPDTTTTTVSSNNNPSTFGQPVTFTTTVTPGTGTSGNPTGTVTFFDGTTSLGTGTLSTTGGVTTATFTTSTLSVESHSITVSYGGDTDHQGSTSSPLTQVVSLDTTTTTVSSNNNPSTFDQPVTFTATVTPGTGTSDNPTGTVTFFDGTTSLGTGTLSTTGGVTTATFTTSALSVELHTITASYGGDTDHQPSTSSSLTQVVLPDTTTTTVSSNNNPSTFGQSVTFTATVTPGTGTSGNPTGTVTFFDGTTSLGTGTLSTTSGVTTATLTTSTLSVGSHSITASYGGDTNHQPSTSSPLAQVVLPDTTTTTVSSNNNPSTFGQSVTFTATVTPGMGTSGNPTGTVTFFDGTTSLGTGTLSTTSGVTTATLTTSTLSVESHTITASYGGDTDHQPSTSSSLTQVVSQDTTTTTITTSGSPSVFGQSVTLTATVKANSPGSGTPTGTVLFLDNGHQIGSGTLSGGFATFTTSSLVVGNHPITAAYQTDGNYSSSTSTTLNQKVNPAQTTTVVSSSLNPSDHGQSVTFNATVASVLPGSGLPTGSVQFSVNGVNLGLPIALTNGRAISNSTSNFNFGTNAIQAVYIPNNDNFVGSTGTLTQSVLGATTTTVFVSPTSSVFGQPIQFSATVTSNVGTPTDGAVQFQVDGVNYGSPVALNNQGMAFLITSSPIAVGPHQVVAVYSGDAVMFQTSTSQPAPFTVIQDSTTTSVTSSINPSVFNQLVSFTATVTATSPGSAIPTGTVIFQIDGNSFPVTLVNGQATLSTSNLSVGNHSVSATYVGNSNFTSSSRSLTQSVEQDDTTTSLTSSLNPSLVGQTVTFTAAVSAKSSGSGTPTGTVIFAIDGNQISVPLVNGEASFSTSTLSAGDHDISATYVGNSGFNGSSDSLPQTINQNNTTTTVTSSMNPSTLGQTVTFTATVISSGSGTPKGTVTFNIDGVLSNPIPLVNGKAIFQTSSLSGGNPTIIALYSGDSSNLPSSGSLIETIIAVLAPRDLEVAQIENRFVTQTDVINVITFKAPLGGNSPVSYRIYRDRALKERVAKISAHDSSSKHSKLSYKDHNRKKGQTYSYYIVSIDEFGNVSEPAKVTFHPKRDHRKS